MTCAVNVFLYISDVTTLAPADKSKTTLLARRVIPYISDQGHSGESALFDWSLRQAINDSSSF